MLEFLSTKIVNFFVAEKAVNDEDFEVYKYGVELILSLLASFTATLIISLITKKFLFFLIFGIFFISLRVFAGGYHADSYRKCFFTTVSVYILYLCVVEIMVDLDYSQNFLINLFALCFNNVTVFRLAPLVHKNNIIDESGIEKNKKNSRIIVIIDSFIIITAFLIKVPFEFITGINIAVFAVTFSMLIEKLRRRREKNET